MSSSYKFLTRLRPNEYDGNIYHRKEQGMIFSLSIGKRKRNSLHTPDDGKVGKIFVSFLSVNKDLQAQNVNYATTVASLSKCKDSVRDNFCSVHKVENNNHSTITNSFP